MTSVDARRPSAWVLSAADLTGDLLRLVALASVVAGGLLYGWGAVGVFSFVLAVILVPRIASLPRPVDIALAVVWLVAGWANAAGWYVTAPWVDIPIHATTPGVTAAAVYLLLVRVQLVPPLQERHVRRAAIVLLTLALGALLAVLWEFYEWLRYDGAGPPLVGYDDTLLDLAMGCLGSLVAGGGLAVWSRAGWGTRRIPLSSAGRG